MIGALPVCTLAALLSRVGARCVHTNQALGSKRPLDTTRGRCCYATVPVHRAKLRIYCAFLKLTYHVRVGRVGYNTSALAMPNPSQCTDVMFERDVLFSFFTVFDVVSLFQVCFAIFPIVKNIEKRICLKFCIANGILCAESRKMLQKAYGESSLSKTRAYEWYSAFKSGRDVVEDSPRSGRPSTSSSEINIAKVKEIVTENGHLSLGEIAAELSVSHESICTILNDCLGMKCFAAGLVPKDLNFLQKLNRVNQRISSNNHRIHLIWLWPTFFFFQNSNYHFEAPIFSR